MNADPVAFFFRHAARHLAPGPHEDPSRAAAAVFNRAYPHGMPMVDYARKTLEQARRAQPAHRKRMLAELARYRIADEVIEGAAGEATAKERQTLRRLRDAARRTAPPRACPARRRPAPGSVVVAQAERAPFTISNVRWASDFVIQRWMHEDDLGLSSADSPPRPATSPSSSRCGAGRVLAFAPRVQLAPAPPHLPPGRRRARRHRPRPASRPVRRSAPGLASGNRRAAGALPRARAHRGRRPDRREAPSMRRTLGRGPERAPRPRASRDRSRDPRPRRPRGVTRGQGARRRGPRRAHARSGGPLPALCEEQRRLARIVAEGLDAPRGDTPLGTLAQAATGTGKTVALLAPVMALAALQKRQRVPAHRATLSTWTNHLTRQIEGDDAPRVSRALEALGYPPVSVAARAGRRQFVDHDRVERAIERLPGADAAALEALLRFPTFAEAELHGVFAPPGLAADSLCLTHRSRPSAAHAFAACREAAATADVVITNHALMLTDCRLRGRVLGARGAGHAVLFDEADALPEAARSVADERIDLALVRDLTDVLGADATGPLDALERLVGHETRSGRHRLLANSARRDDILALVAKVGDALARAVASDEETAEEAENLVARLASFDECARSNHTIAAIAAGPTPALAVIHREPVRVLRRLLETTPPCSS